MRTGTRARNMLGMLAVGAVDLYGMHSIARFERGLTRRTRRWRLTGRYTTR